MTKLQLLRFVTTYIDTGAFIGYLIGCLIYKKYKSLRPIAYLMLLTIVRNQFSSYEGMYIRNLKIVDHFNSPIQMIFLGWFFYLNFETVVVKKYVPYVVTGALVFAVINTVLWQGWSVYPSNFMILETLILIIWAIILFIEKLDAPASVNIFKDPVFITTTAILCFNVFSFIYFLLNNYFTKHNIYMFNSIVNILYFSNFIYYALLVTAFIYSYKLVKNSATSRW